MTQGKGIRGMSRMLKARGKRWMRGERGGRACVLGRPACEGRLLGRVLTCGGCGRRGRGTEGIAGWVGPPHPKGEVRELPPAEGDAKEFAKGGRSFDWATASDNNTDEP
jgi:hypothetical protein